MPHDHPHHDDPESRVHSLPPDLGHFGHVHSTPVLAQNASRTRWVVWLTLVTMFVELGFGGLWVQGLPCLALRLALHNMMF